MLASAAGCEPDGRRRQVVLLTDRRLLIAAVRGGTPTELGVDTTSASYETDRALLVLEADGQPVAMVRDVEVTAASQIMRLLGDQHSLPGRATTDEVKHVRIRRDVPPV